MGTNQTNQTLQFFAFGGDNAVYTKAQDILLAPQLLAGTPVAESGVADLTESELGSIVVAAEARWEGLGVSASQFAGLQFQITTLSNGWLGAYLPGTVFLDSTADGYGWFVDPTPGLDEEFAPIGGQELALPGNAAAGRIDLLTVVMHELGHALGLNDGSGATDIMAEALAAGVRRAPTMVDVDAAFGSTR